IDYKVINLNHSFNTLLKELEANVNKITQNQNSKKIARANLKPRLRMTVLYYYANLNNYLVVGTDNKSELKLGYFTKYGDGGIDIAPLGNLVKTEVKKIAEILNIPKPIINKKPSAGLWEGQNDENELGISYKKIDKYILTGKADNKTKKIEDKYSYQNQHKLKPPTIPEF
ncbi:MAG: NAD(+) synthase, partial [bacterium]